MTRNDFINRLRETLSEELSAQKVQEHVNFYSDYIVDEVRKGRKEADVVAELGDPWAIAKNIIDSEEIKGETQEEYSYEPRRSNYEQEQQSAPKAKVSGVGGWKFVLIILGIVGVLMAVIAVIGGIVSLLAPFIIPVIIISFVIKVFGNRRR